MVFAARNVIDPNAEINRLRELMPATGRMKTRLQLNDAQPRLIGAAVPRPWQTTYPITLNLRLWEQLTQPQRDLLFLQTLCWVITVNLVKPDWYQGLAAVGLLGGLFELSRGDALGLVAAAGLTTFAGLRIWRTHQGIQADIAADEKAVQIAQRRGYTQAEAAQALLTALEAVPRIEGRSGLSATDLVRCQNLRTLVGLAAAPLPKSNLRP